MFGLTRREQQWKAEQQAAEVLVGFATAAIQSRAHVDAAEAQANSNGVLGGLRSQVLRAEQCGDEAMHKLRIAEQVLQALVRRCEIEMADTIDVPEIQVARALLGLGA